MIRKKYKKKLIENIKGNITGKFMGEVFLETHLGHQEVLVNFGINLLPENETKKKLRNGKA